MANVKVTILHDVWEEGPPEPEPEPVKAPRGKSGKRRKKKKTRCTIVKRSSRR